MLRSLGIVLLATIALSAMAQDPEVRCGPTGDIAVELNGPLPLPNGYNNPTDWTVTFNIIDNSLNIFNFPSPIVDPRFGTLILKPHERRDIPDLNFPVPPSTPTGTDP